MSQWEYDTFAFQEMNGAALLEAMNQKGKEGWEYCGQSCVPVANGLMFVYLFKRPAKLIKVVGGLS